MLQYNIFYFNTMVIKVIDAYGVQSVFKLAKTIKVY